MDVPTAVDDVVLSFGWQFGLEALSWEPLGVTLVTGSG
jgi:hypothetical protein